MTYKLCMRLLALGKLTAKMLDVFFAAGRLADEECAALMSDLSGEE